MKNVIVILILFAVIFTGCATEANVVTNNQSGDIEFDNAMLTENIKALGLYGDGMILSEDEIGTQLQLDMSNIESAFVIKHSDPMKASTCMVFKPFDGKEDQVKTEVANFLDLYKDSFDLYAPEEYALIEDYYTIDKGAYIIYTISEDNEAVIGAINKSKK